MKGKIGLALTGLMVGAAVAWDAKSSSSNVILGFMEEQLGATRYFNPALMTEAAGMIGVMGAVCCFFAIVILIFGLLEKKARENPLVIELSHNTALGSWGDKKDVMIGAPFSDDRDLIANGKVLLNSINKIIETYSKQKGGWRARMFVAIRPKMSDRRRLSEGERALIEKVLDNSFADDGSVFG